MASSSGMCGGKFDNIWLNACQIDINKKYGIKNTIICFLHLTFIIIFVADIEGFYS